MIVSIKPVTETGHDLVSLGEVMVRFDPGETRISRTRSFTVWEGGGEYNVARGLRRCFGMKTAIVTALVDNPVGRLVEDLMLQGGVDLRHVLWSKFDSIGRESRNGIYFLERGFGRRGAVGMMDRGHTAISQVKPGEIDWDGIFTHARWFHTGGVMAALSEHSTAVVLEAMLAAKRHGVVVSFDANYRPSLWKERGGRRGAVEVNRMLAEHVDVFFGHDGDLSAELGKSSQGPAWHTVESFGEMAQTVIRDFPGLKVLATTMRRVHSASSNDWGAFAYANGAVAEGIRYNNLEIFDRVGGGDSFASGLIYGLLMGRDLKWSLDCGVAHGALAMLTPGDSSMATLAEVEGLMAGDGAGVKR